VGADKPNSLFPVWQVASVMNPHPLLARFAGWFQFGEKAKLAHGVTLDLAAFGIWCGPPLNPKGGPRVSQRLLDHLGLLAVPDHHRQFRVFWAREGLAKACRFGGLW
jgi:hypothetical protein